VAEGEKEVTPTKGVRRKEQTKGDSGIKPEEPSVSEPLSTPFPIRTEIISKAKIRKKKIPVIDLASDSEPQVEEIRKEDYMRQQSEDEQ
jgi:hypothetical protein